MKNKKNELLLFFGLVIAIIIVFFVIFVLGNNNKNSEKKDEKFNEEVPGEEVVEEEDNKDVIYDNYLVRVDSIPTGVDDLDENEYSVDDYKISTKGDEDNIITEILNYRTNKTYKVDGYVEYISGGKKAYFYTDDGLVDGETFTVIDNTKDKYIIGDYIALGTGDGIFTHNSNYVVVKNNNEKYGLMDFSGKMLIDFIYDDLITTSDKYLLANKNGKFGVVDSSNNIIVKFEYDGVDYVNNRFILLKNDKIGVLNKDLKEIVPFNVKYKMVNAFSLRLCCGSENDFEVVYASNDELVITFINDKVDEDSRYGYGTSYLVVKKDDSYEVLDNYMYHRYYNYSYDEYYYFEKSKDKIEVYDSNKKLVKEKKCTSMWDSNVYYANKDIIYISCEDDIEYYNLKTKKNIGLDEIEKLWDEVYSNVFKTGNEVIFVDYSGGVRVMASLKNVKEVNNMFDIYYEVKYEDGSIKYYKENAN